MVLAPAEDGGYALIAARRIDPRLFAGIRWGADDVLARTLDNARRCGLTCRLLRTVWDVDRPEDVDRLRTLRFRTARSRIALTRAQAKSPRSACYTPPPLEEEQVQIKSPKDFWAGLMFIGFGLFFAIWAVTHYQMGTAVRMGPAYFPAVLGGLLTRARA